VSDRRVRQARPGASDRRPHPRECARVTEYLVIRVKPIPPPYPRTAPRKTLPTLVRDRRHGDVTVGIKKDTNAFRGEDSDRGTHEDPRPVHYGN
jgi:hypothetical protein